MSNKLAAALGPDTESVRNELMRRRELTGMTKTQLIDYIISIEDNLHALAARIEHAYGNEP